MPTKKATTGKKTGGRKGDAKIDSGVGGVAALEADPPIIIQGGGSIDLDVPSKFKEKSSGPNGKKFKNDLGNLESIVIDDAVTIKLKPTSKIVINYT
jgi:hypothetical protein